MNRACLAVLAAAAAMLVAQSASAQTFTGTPGSPRATVTLEGKQIPPPPMPFGGVIKESALDAKPYWPPLPFRFTGTIDKLTFKLGPSQLSAAEQKVKDELIARRTD